MPTSSSFLFACAFSLAGVTYAAAQVRTIPGEKTTITAVVESVEQSTRTLTLRDQKGELRTMTVPQSVTKFPEIKVGDKLTATYYDNITLRMKPPGEKDVDTLSAGVTPGGGRKPVGTVAAQQTITATIDAIDMNVPSISFKGPRGWSYTTKVQDKEALSKVKVGEKVDITWTEALLVSFNEPTKGS
jgi:hypothetical protein